MTSRSFLDSMDDLLSPLEKAQAAIMEDNPKKLLPLLAKSSASLTGIKEETVVNVVVSENLLDFAVHQLSAYCVMLLTSEPFNWSPTRKNKIGQTPLERALQTGYIPVIYPLMAVTTYAASAGLTQTLSASRSLHALLLDPVPLFTEPLNSIEIVKILFDEPSSASPSSFQVNSAFLLLELAFANRELTCLPFTGSLPAPFPCSTCAQSPNEYVGDAVVSCLLTSRSDFTVNMSECLALWSWHRQKKKNSSDKSLVSPLLLMDWCRITIRRAIVNAMRASEDEQKRGTYANRVAVLKLPPRLHAFLAFRDIWPIQSRHDITRFRYNRFIGHRVPQGHYNFLDNDALFNGVLLDE